MKESINETINRFEATDRTVKSFNSVFMLSPLKEFKDTDRVSIGSMVNGELRTILINGTIRVTHQLIPVMRNFAKFNIMAKDKSKTRLRSEVRRSNMPLNVGSKFYTREDLLLDNNAFKLLHYLVFLNGESFNTYKASTDMKMSRATVTKHIRTLTGLGLISVERYNGIRLKIQVLYNKFKNVELKYNNKLLTLNTISFKVLHYIETSNTNYFTGFSFEEDLRISPKSFRNSLKELEINGMINIERHGGLRTKVNSKEKLICQPITH